ncbi:hypothetical protein E2C01_074673 [Portunus trituberculatus]|uniref:Uncharacterized protein n=1 Tax=Portunus trituberculatus TaxID=210409 RepID=A0A5B7IDR8_PORTR|nr:hypothetical protein [Portunus trituberculatus]
MQHPLFTSPPTPTAAHRCSFNISIKLYRLVEAHGEAGGGEYGASTQDNPCTQKGLACCLAVSCISRGGGGTARCRAAASVFITAAESEMVPTTTRRSGHLWGPVTGPVFEDQTTQTCRPEASTVMSVGATTCTLALTLPRLRTGPPDKRT